MCELMIFLLRRLMFPGLIYTVFEIKMKCYLPSAFVMRLRLSMTPNLNNIDLIVEHLSYLDGILSKTSKNTSKIHTNTQPVDVSRHSVDIHKHKVDTCRYIVDTVDV